MAFEDFGIVPSEVYIKSSSSLEEHQDFFTGKEARYGIFKYANSSNDEEHIYNIFHKKSNKSFQFLFDKNIDGHIVIEQMSDDAHSYNIKSLRNPKFILLFNTTFIVPEMHLKQDFDPNKHRANISDFNNEIEKLVCCPKSDSPNTTENEVVEKSPKKTIDEFGRLGMALEKSSDDRILIVAPTKDSHAHSLGILAGDIISEIDGETTLGMTVSEAIYRSQGEAGTEVNMRIVRHGVPNPIDYTITREVMDVGRWATFDSQEASVNEYGGIGIGITETQDDGIPVALTLEGGPAQKAGILEGDIISEIDGETTLGMTTEEVTSKMRGEVGTQINIRVIRSGVSKPIDYTITRALIEVESTIEFESTSETLIEASKEGHLEEVKAFIESGADLNAVDREYGTTALMVASQNGHTEVVKVLIEAGADVNMLDIFERTALMEATESEHLEVVKVLIAAGADVNAKNTSKSRIDTWRVESKAPKNSIVVKIVPSIFLLIGLFLLIPPFHAKLTCTNETIAEVVDMESTGSISSGYTYSPIFSYNVNGEQIIVRYHVAMNPSPYRVGDTLTLFYNPNKPERFYIGGFSGGNWIQILFGSIFMIVFILFFKNGAYI